MASQLAQNKPKLFCGVAEASGFAFRGRIEHRRDVYATIIIRLDAAHLTGQRLRTDRTSCSVALEESKTVVRNGKLY